MFKRSVVGRILLLCTLLLLPIPVFASSMSIVKSGDSSFVIQGSLQNVAGIYLSVSYDSTTLSISQSSQVTMGGLTNGMMSAINPSNPIRIIAVKTSGTTGSGVIATINFDLIGSAAGAVTVSGYGVDPNQKMVALGSVSYQPAVASADTTSTTSSNSGNSGTSGTTGTGTTNGTTVPVVGGTVTMPSSDTPATANKNSTPQPAAQESPERQAVAQNSSASASGNEAKEEVQAPAPKTATESAPAPKQVQSVLDKFRLFEGEKTPQSLIALFSRDSGGSYSQSPAIAIADGKASVRLTISKVADKSPRFTFNAARYVSLAQVGDGEWEVEVVPERGALKASVNMLASGIVQEFPLTVAPRANVAVGGKSGEVSEADFALFLRERGSATAPKYDLNGDGKRDYLDDYIFTANYLVKMEEQANRKGATQQKPVATSAQ